MAHPAQASNADGLPWSGIVNRVEAMLWIGYEERVSAGVG
jgi:hypothetical protein